jgi:hypothetical protein
LVVTVALADKRAHAHLIAIAAGTVSLVTTAYVLASCTAERASGEN